MKRLCLLCSLLLSSQVFSSDPDLLLGKDAETYSEVFSLYDGLEATGLQLELVRIRASFELGVEVPYIGSAKFKPEIEFFFTRE